MATNNYMPMGRNPRSGGAGQAASYKKGGMIKTKKYQGSGSNTVDPTKAINTFKKNTSMKKGGTTEVAGVMGKGGVKYQDKGTVKSNMVKGVMAINAAAKEAKLEASRPKTMKKIVKIKR